MSAATASLLLDEGAGCGGSLTVGAAAAVCAWLLLACSCEGKAGSVAGCSAARARCRAACCIAWSCSARVPSGGGRGWVRLVPGLVGGSSLLAVRAARSLLLLLSWTLNWSC